MKKHLTNILRRKRSYLVAVILIGLTVHVFLFVSQSGRSTVLLRGQVVGQDSRNIIELQQAAIRESNLLVIKGETVEQGLALADMGVTFELSSLSSDVQSAQSWQHKVPLWGAWKLTQPINLSPTYSIDKDMLTQAALEFSQQLSSDPVDARLEVVDSKILVVPERVGYSYSSQDLYDKVFKEFSESGTHQIQLQATERAPALVASDLDDVAQKYAGISSQKLTIVVDSAIFELSISEVLQMVDVSRGYAVLDQARVDELVVAWSQQVARSAGITQVGYVDDVEVSRSAGLPGVRLPAESVLGALEGWLADPSISRIQIFTEAIAPKVVESRSYSASSAGLQAVLDAWQREHSGTYHVSVQELGGQGREASSNASTQTVMASTYKVFLSVVAYSLIENGQLAATTIIDSGKNVEQCIKGGIVDSENTCMVALGRHIGWDTVDTTLSDMGFQNILLNNYNSDGSYNGDKVAPAQELAKLLKQLADSSIISTAHTNSLLGYMKQQVYRDGIPAGSSGAVVANKVGFLYAYIHDMGIVYGPNSTYALVIMTENSDWAAIADLSSKIYEVMN